MAKLTRPMFLTAVDDVWGGVQASFARDQRIHSHLIALDAKAEMKYFLSGADPDDRQLVAKGIVGVPGPWHEHLPLLAAEFHAHRAVAALLVAEAWWTTGEAALETVRMDIAPSEHPLKDEIVFVVGLWPREYAARSRYAVIDRGDGRQPPRLGESQSFESTIGDSNVATVLATWLTELLPRPFH